MSNRFKNFLAISVWAAGVALLYHFGYPSWAVFLFSGGLLDEIRRRGL